MKVLQMSRWFFPHVGGASIRVYEIAKNLTELGHEVHLLTHNPKSIEQCNLDEKVLLYEKRPEGFYVYRLPYYPLGKKFNWGVSIPLMAKKAVDIIKKEKIDVILSHNPPYLVGEASVIASRLTGKPIVTVVHDIWGASHYGFFEYRVGKFLEKRCVRKSKKLIVPLKGLDKSLIARYNIPKERFVVASTGVDVERFKPVKADKEQLMLLEKNLELSGVGRKTIDKIIDPKFKKVLFVGILAPWSGCMQLVEAAERIVDKKKGVLFIVVGQGVQSLELMERVKERGISQNFFFLGTLPHESLPALINLSDVCASPFPRPESVGRDAKMPIRPISTLEFLSCGKPVIMSDVPGAREMIEDGRTGVLFAPERIDGLVEKIEYLLENPVNAEEVGKAARKAVLKSSTWKSTALVVEGALKDALAK